MRLGDLQKRHGDFYTPRFSVAVRREEIREFQGLVSDLSVTNELVGPDQFSFTLNYPFDPETGTFPDLDWDRFDIGERVEIRMGYENPLPRVFVGSIASLRPDAPSGDTPTVGVSGFGLLHDLTRGEYNETWNDMTDGQVVEDFFANPGRRSSGRHSFVDARVTSTPVEREAVHQMNQSDFSFLTMLAEWNGYELFARLDTVHFRKPNYAAEPVLTLEYGESLDSFSPQLDNPSQVGVVEYHHWDEMTKRHIVGRAPSGGPTAAGEGGGQIERVFAPVDSLAEAELLARTRLARRTEGRVTATAETIGVPEIRPGDRIRLEGLGPAFTNTYYLKRVTHTVGRTGYRTSFEVMQPPNSGTGR